ncbi:hypothetical protein ADK38_28600, partial [Streptomyces varsoviensis]
LVLSEAKIVGVAGSAAGCALSLLGAPLLADWLVGHGIAPEWFSAPLSWESALLLVAAFALGVLLAWLGAGVSALRAGRVRPLEALHESENDGENDGANGSENGSEDASAAQRPAIPLARRLAGLAVLVCALALLAAAPLLPPLYWAGLTTLAAPALILACTLLSPLVIPLITRLVTAWPARGRGAGAMLVQAAALTSIRRTAATAAPVLITVGLACSLWSTSGSIQTARSREVGQQVRDADLVVTPGSAPGLSRATVDKVRAVPGVDAAATTPTTVFTVPGPDPLLYPAGAPLLPYPARAVTPAELAAVLTLPVVSGSLADFADDRTIVVDESWHRAAGDKVTVWLADGREVSLRVAAVLRAGLGDGGVFVSSRYAGTRLPDALYVKPRPGADPATVRAAVEAAADDGFAEAVPRERWTARVDARKAAETRLALLFIGGIAVLYTGVAIANTLVMSTRHRARELALLRLSGLTPAQVLRVVAAEALLVVAVGLVLAAGVAALSLGGLWIALQQIVSGTPVVVPAGPVAGTAAACALIALLATVAPAWHTLRTPAVRMVSAGG